VRKIKGGAAGAPSRICSTCNLEKLEIALADKRSLLNKRAELSSSCPHFRKKYFKRPKK
jgi:hypothetical protein